ncbi:MAG: riboflavin synthase [Oscillospiraceae bacterium]|nr:riboflavin synthase [Oscillospiraceae bacterium]
MFTGIIEEIGTIERLERGTRSARLTIAGSVIFSDLKLGDSVAVNGVCLTASSINGTAFTADVMPETLDRTALGVLRVGSRVNLERAMAANGRFGGHMVAGHVDGVGKIVSVRPDDNAVHVRIAAGAEILRYVIQKGSVAIDGISLTVAEVDANGFGVSIIPHTADETTLLSKGAGDLVNLEVDLVGKYVEKLLGTHTPNRITTDFLATHGFM